MWKSLSLLRSEKRSNPDCELNQAFSSRSPDAERLRNDIETAIVCLIVAIKTLL